MNAGVTQAFPPLRKTLAVKSEVEKDLPRFAELDAEYEILLELGRGGTAVVYLARERELGRRVAIKVIRSTYIEDEEAAARLAREARTIASLEHPNIVALHGTRRLRDNSLALIMQYVPGRTLKSEVQSMGPLSFEKSERVLTDVGRALACAQRHRIVHRDVKPENVYLDDETGIARLSDFGIARPWDSDQGLTLPGMAIGTPAYMSPEQIDGAVLDGRADLYSLGLVGYEMLTGRSPWAGESLFNMIYKQKNEPLPPLERVRPGIPRALLHALEGALQKNRDDRWRDADEFLEALTGRVAFPVGRVMPMAERMSPQPAPVAEPENPTVQYRRAEVLRSLQPERSAEVIEAPAARHPERTNGPTAIVPAPADIVPYRVRPAARLTEPTGVELTNDFETVAAEKPRKSRRLVVAAIGLPIMVVGTAVIIGVTRDAKGGTTPDIGITAAAAAPASKAAVDDPDSSAVKIDHTPIIAYVLAGDDQSGVVGEPLKEPLSISVSDAAGRPVAGATVNFEVSEGEGTVSPAVAVTDSSGIAATHLKPGSVGVQTVTATVKELNGKVTKFSARAVPKPATQLAAVSPAELQGIAGAALSNPLVVKAQDAQGNPVSGVQVRFAVRSGEGRVTSSAVTGTDGTARAEWTLISTGSHEVEASLGDAPRVRTSFRATAASPLLPIRRGVAAGGTHTCALNSEGSADCWGGNEKGQLGDGSSSRRAAPIHVSAPEPLANLAAGVSHTCAVGVSGSAFCWGGNSSGQLGDGSRADHSEPVRVTAEKPFVSIFAGMAHTCGLDSAGALYCWGENDRGQLGDGTRNDRATPVRAGGGRTFRTVALGWSHTCGLTSDGMAYCWGKNANGELGDGSSSDRSEPAAVAGGIRFSSIAAGSAHTCGLTATGRIFCWGQNTFGQLGSGSTDNSSVPVEVSPVDSFSSVTLGSVHTCALTREGAARCWGRNTYGQLGDGTLENKSRPTAVEGNFRFSSLQASGAHTCGTSGGTSYCWGYNVDGQLGNGTRTNQTRPVPAGRN